MSADFTPEKEDYKLLPPFKMQVLTNFPYIEADFDALTNYQLLCKVVEYLNNVIANENEVTEQVTSLYNAYVSLQNYVNNYFDNLNVQTEINNKLDEMATDGTLTNLIKGYVDPIYQAYEAETTGVVNGLEDRIDAQDLDIYNFKNTVNSQLATMNNRVISATSGSPAGVYATAAALTSDDPDHSKIYLVTADGKWYYYDTSTTSWVAGGTYQATQISNGEITPEKTNFMIKVLNNNNLLDPDAFTENYYIGNSTETPIALANYGYYLTEDLEAGETYSVGGYGSFFVSCFDESGTNVLFFEKTAQLMSWTIPATAYHTYISVSLGSLEHLWITKGETPFNYITPYLKTFEIDEDIINMEKYKLATIVDITGKGDYQSLATAVSNASSGDIIIVKPGNYTNEVVEAFGKELYIIGTDRERCIISNDNCDYETPPIEFGAGLLKNLSIISKYDATNYANVVTYKSYGLHIEDNNLTNKKLLVENCYIESQVNCAVGMGTRGGCYVEFNNCWFNATSTREADSKSPLYFHDASNVTYAGIQNISFKNNKMTSTYNGTTTELRIESQGTAGSTVNVEFINNVIINSTTGTITNRFLDHASGQWKTNFDDLTNFTLTYTSFGNNDTKVNK